MTTAVWVDAVRENPRLLALAHSFNQHPALHIHPTKFAGFLPESVVDLLRNSRRGERRLSHWSIRHWGLGTEGFWDFADPRRRLALVDTEALHQLLRFAGAAIHAQTIKRTIDRRASLEFREVLGERGYNFAVKRAGLLLRGIPSDLKPKLPDLGELREWLEEAGRRCLTACLSDIPGELKQRLELKLVRETQWDAGTTDDQTRQNLWVLLERILLTEIKPELKPCFS